MNLRKLVFISLFTALICVSSFWSIPLLPGIPIVLKNLVIVLSGALLGSWYGALSVLLYLLCGVLGLPVFANAGGLAAFLSPAGGYMIGYALGSLVTGLLAGQPALTDKRPQPAYIARLCAALALGFAVILVCGAIWLLLLNSKAAEPKPAIAVFLGGIVPFLPADSIKFALAIPVSLALRPLAALYIGRKSV